MVLLGVSRGTCSIGLVAPSFRGIKQPGGDGDDGNLRIPELERSLDVGCFDEKVDTSAGAGNSRADQ